MWHIFCPNVTNNCHLLSHNVSFISRENQLIFTVTIWGTRKNPKTYLFCIVNGLSKLKRYFLYDKRFDTLFLIVLFATVNSKNLKSYKKFFFALLVVFLVYVHYSKYRLINRDTKPNIKKVTGLLNNVTFENRNLIKSLNNSQFHIVKH